MGLGKTVQTIALLAHLAEERGIWGPFLIVSPTSTLPNWANEIQKFCPKFSVIPYWGTALQRKTLRKVMDPKYLHREDSPCHVVVTSYNLVVLDKKFFGKLKWEYLILDEAHSIKNSSSTRWNTLLSFGNCRNRLLLTGTPIQNSSQYLDSAYSRCRLLTVCLPVADMAELWALLHFIMPTLFDSHNEFYEWFSKDIEQSAETNSAVNEHQLRRLHMILKPFMLRRIKKDVADEMPSKTELEIKCELSPRQVRLYRGIRNKITVAELLGKWSDKKSSTHLMNLVMQFRKVCNHPETFERREVMSPFVVLDPDPCELPSKPPVDRNGRYIVSPAAHSCLELSIPRLVHQEATENLSRHLSGRLYSPKEKILLGMLNIYQPENCMREIRTKSIEQLSVGSLYSILRFSSLSPGEGFSLAQADPLERWRCRKVPTLVAASCNTPQIPAFASVVGRFSDATSMLRIFRFVLPKAVASPPALICADRGFAYQQHFLMNHAGLQRRLLGRPMYPFVPEDTIGEEYSRHPASWLWGAPPAMAIPFFEAPGVHAPFIIPKFEDLVNESGKMKVLDELLGKLKAGKHRVLIYSQFALMLDVLEDYLMAKRYKFVRLDGTSRLDERRDVVDAFQNDESIFCFILSTRAGGLGITLTAADSVIFYDSDWNPTQDQQAMDRAHRLGQTKPVTVYRLITRGTVEERILMRARQKHAIQQLVIRDRNEEDESPIVIEDADVFQTGEMVDLLADETDLESRERLLAATQKKRARSALPLSGSRRRSTKHVTPPSASAQ